MTVKKPVIITPGEPAGIGAEITIKAWLAGKKDICFIDNPDRIKQIANQLNAPINIKTIDDVVQFTKLENKLHILPIEWPVTPIFGKPDSRNGSTVIKAIETAVELCRENIVAGMVTNPIHKSTLYNAGFGYPGHTEFLASKCEVEKGGPLMMLNCPELNVVPLTIHIPLDEVPETISRGSIIAAGKLIDKCLRKYFARNTPSIAVTGLNPHAGEDNKMGHEEKDIIIPAINDLRLSGVNATGPFPADTLFHPEARKKYDAVIGMYHDQVLIPIKTIDFYGSVNITLGLDFIRTSPDHGTGLDIAGDGSARAESLIAAITMATKMHLKAEEAFE